MQGEVDIATAPRLQSRLAALRSEGVDVQLDLSGVEFIDVGGARVIWEAVRSGTASEWNVEIASELPPPVRRLFWLLGIDPRPGSKPPGTMAPTFPGPKPGRTSPL